MKKIIITEKAPKAIGPYSQAVKAGEYLFMSGQIPLDPATAELVENDIKVQTKQCLQNLKAVVEAAGGTMNDIVKTTVLMKDMALFAEMNEVYRTFFTADPPARATYGVVMLPKDALIEIEAIAYIK